MSIYEVTDVLIDYGTNPSIACCIELEALFTLTSYDSGLDFLTWEGTIKFISGRLLNGFGDKSALGIRDQGKGVVEKMMRLIAHRGGSLHKLK